MLWLHLFVNTDFTFKKGILNYIAIVVLIIYAVINTTVYVTGMTAHKKVNELDKKLVSQIEQHVKEYEISHNTKITKMAVVINQYQTYKTFYENVPYSGATIVHSAVRSDWSSIGCYNYYQTGQSLKTYYPTNEEKIDFLNLQKEYQCMNDTLYVTAYMY